MTDDDIHDTNLPYHVAPRRGPDDRYGRLVGPREFEVEAGVWWIRRWIHPVAVRLNEQHAEIERLRDRLRDEENHRLELGHRADGLTYKLQRAEWDLDDARDEIDRLRAALKVAMRWWEWHSAWEGRPTYDDIFYEEMDGSSNEVDDHATCREALGDE
jgi:hypothetical protein